MTVRLHRLARRLWSGELGRKGRLLSAALVPLSVLWRVVTWLRNRRFDRGGVYAVDGLAVVSIGNLAVGGTGKTPMASWVATTFSSHGVRPAILLRGYGRDEALLHERWTPDLEVLARGDRLEAARRARADGAEVAVLDDGFQHRRLARALDIVLLAVEDPLEGHVLPRGPYREPLHALQRASAVVMTRRTASLTDARAFEAALLLGAALPEHIVTAGVRFALDGVATLEERAARVEGVPLGDALALTAVARPEAFRRAVEALSEGAVELLDFPDHHDFTTDDARAARARAGDRPIVVTEKDAVKLRALAGVLGDVRVLRQRLDWDWGEDEIRGLLAEVAMGVHGRRARAPRVVPGEGA